MINNLKQKLQLAVKRVLAHLPSRLPLGVTEFETWASDIITTYQMPDNNSVRFSLAVMIMHLDATSSHKPKAYFGRCLIKGASTQVAHFIMQDLKEKQVAEEKKAQEAQLAEVTATPVTSDEPTQN